MRLGPEGTQGYLGSNVPDDLSSKIRSREGEAETMDSAYAARRALIRLASSGRRFCLAILRS